MSEKKMMDEWATEQEAKYRRFIEEACFQYNVMMTPDVVSAMALFGQKLLIDYWSKDDEQASGPNGPSGQW